MISGIKAKWIDEFARAEDGVIGIELGAIAGVLTIVLLGMIQYATALHQNVQLQQAARAGAEYAIKNPADTSGIEQAVIDATSNPSDGLTITITQFCECPDGTAISCTDTCTGSVSPDQFMKVALAQPATQMLSASGSLPGVTLRAEATMRSK